MKIQCDVCNKDEATMFCVADEAALCEACDHRVHHANKLAGKHQRFSLLQPSAKEAPVCDICQERRAFLFCQQDRAILCRECDISIHKANEHTQKHNRYLLTGVKLPATSTLFSSSSSSSPPSSATSLSNGSDAVPIFNPQSSMEKPVSSLLSTTTPYQQSATIANTAVQAQQETTAATSDHKDGGYNNIHQLISGPTSSISEYLIEMLPGWHVEDFLDSSTPNGFCKTSEDDVQPFWDADLGKNLYAFSAAADQSSNLWVPQVPPPVLPTTIPTYPSAGIAIGAQVGFKESKDVTIIKPSRKLSDDNSFAVPQICPPSTPAFKRSRTLW